MGAPGAVQILHRRELAAIDDDAERLAEQLALEAEYAERFANPYVAAERGYVDDVIAAADTRRVLAAALDAARAPSASTQPRPPSREHTALGSRRDDAHAARRQEHPRHRRAQRRVDRVLGRAPRPGAGRRGRAHARSAGSCASPSARPAGCRRRRADRRARRHATRTTSTALAGDVGGKLDGVVHAIGFAPESCLGGGFLDAPWEDVAVALQVSAYSLKALAVAALPLMERGRLDRRASTSTTTTSRGRSTTGWAWPRRRSSRSRATSPATSGPQGIRVNLVAAGPVRTHRGQEHPRLRGVRGGVGRAGAARLGRPGRRARSPRRASRCCPTGSRPPPARSSTSTAASTPSAPDRCRRGGLPSDGFVKTDDVRCRAYPTDASSDSRQAMASSSTATASITSITGSSRNVNAARAVVRKWMSARLSVSMTA